MRLPVAVPPARHETVASYLARLASLHGLAPGELWHQVSSPQPGTRRRDVDPGRLAAITGRPAEHLARALPELRRPGPDWQAWRHQPQPGCPRCDARHDGGPVTRLLPHHRYVCTRHRYWIGPPDAGQPATPLGPELAGIVQAQWRHLRLLRRYGPALTYDAVLTGFLLCGHLWTDQPGDWDGPWQRWTRRAEILIPPGAESSQFSASRIFAAAYPEAVALAGLIASPAWRSLRRRRPRRAAAVHRRDRAAARPARLPARRHQRRDRALDEIRQLAAAQPAAHHLPADPPIRIQPGPGGYHQQAEPPAARTQQPVVSALPPRRPRHPAPRPHPARPDPRLVTARWTASPPPSGPARPRCLPGLTTASTSPHRERGPARRARHGRPPKSQPNLDARPPECPTNHADHDNGQLPRNLRLDRTASR